MNTNCECCEKSVKQINIVSLYGEFGFDFICKKCFNSIKYTCECCEKSVKQNQLKNSEGKLICKKCMKRI
jgi:hypothetical protein